MMRPYEYMSTDSKITLLPRRESVYRTKLLSANEVDTVQRSIPRVQNNKTDQSSFSY
jgi:hypothetical protein